MLPLNNLTTLVSISALTMSLATSAFAADEAKHAGHELDMKFRTVYFDRDYDNDANDRVQSAFATEFNYKSPKIADKIRVGISAYGVQELESDGRVTTDILKAENGNIESFGLIGQAYAEINPTEKSMIKIGRQKHKSMLLSSSGSRAVPNTYQGISGKVKISKQLSLYGAAYNKWSPRGSDDFDEFRTDQSAEGAIDFIGVIGGKYKSGPYMVEAEYLNSKDYLSKLGLRGSYTHKLATDSKLKFTGGFFTSSDDGDLFVTGAEGGDLDDEDVAGSTVGVTKSSNDGKGAYIEAAWKKNKTTMSAAVSKFDDVWIEDNFRGDHGRNPFPTRSTLGPDLTNANETAARLKLAHDWKGTVNGLKTHVAIGKGWDAENSALGSAGGTADEDWWEVKAVYKIPAVKGLKFTGLYHDYDTDETGSVDGVKGAERDVRLYLDYTYKFR